MTDTLRVPAGGPGTAAMDESEQPILIRRLDRLETTHPNPDGNS